MANKLKNCPNCGKLYLDTGVGMCPDCRAKEAEDEDLVSSYVRDNPRTSVAAVCEATGVSEKIVRRMIRQGRFLSVPGIEFEYPCTKCGKMIKHGDYCDACQKELTESIVAQQKKNIETGFGMKKAGMYSMERTSIKDLGNQKK